MELLSNVAAANSPGKLPAPSGRYHVYVSHVYGDVRAALIKDELEGLDVKVMFPNAFIPREDEIESDLNESDIVVVIVTSSFLKGVASEHGGVFQEFDLVKTLKADVEREIIYVIADTKVTSESKGTENLPLFKEMTPIQMTNDKEVSTDSFFPLLFTLLSSSKRTARLFIEK